MTVHLIIGAGQSNMLGKAPVDAADVPDPRVWQYGWHGRSLQPATVPLDAVNEEEGMGLSPLWVVARDYVATLAEDDVVVVLPGGRGGAGLTVDVGYGWWDTSAADSYFPGLLTRIAEARAAAQERFGTEPVVEVLLWHQGETDATQGVTEEQYAAGFDALVDLVRHAAGRPDLPVVVGGMVPEWVQEDPVRHHVQAAHEGTPARLPRSAFAPGVVGGGGSAGPDDLVHYGRDAVIELGRRMLEAWRSIA